jgi:hypothetical protein
LLDDDAAFNTAISALRAAIGDHPRVLQIEMDADDVAIEAEDPRNRRAAPAWLESVTIGGHMFVPQAGARAIAGPRARCGGGFSATTRRHAWRMPRIHVFAALQ